MTPGPRLRQSLEQRPLLEQVAQEIAERLGEAKDSATDPPSEKARLYFEGARDGLKGALEAIEKLIEDNSPDTRKETEDRAMTMKETIEAAMGNPDYSLTAEEFDAVYDWLNAEKDGLPFALKQGLLKLVNGEARRRM